MQPVPCVLWPQDTGVYIPGGPKGLGVTTWKVPPTAGDKSEPATAEHNSQCHAQKRTTGATEVSSRLSTKTRQALTTVVKAGVVLRSRRDSPGRLPPTEAPFAGSTDRTVQGRVVR